MTVIGQVEFLYSTNEVRKMIGASMRQVDYWTREGFVKPEHKGGSGAYRRWRSIDVQVAQVLAEASALMQSRMNSLYGVISEALYAEPELLDSSHFVILYREHGGVTCELVDFDYWSTIVLRDIKAFWTCRLGAFPEMFK